MSATLQHPLEDEDLLSEILLRLPPQPSSLPRASAVCKCWRRLISDRGFLRRFRRHHRRSPPLLGFFRKELQCISYTPVMEVPDRVPAARFSLHLGESCYFRFLSCRHGLVLISRPLQNQILVWDPVTGGKYSVAAPLGFDMRSSWMEGAVLRAAGDAHHFQVVLVCYDYENEQAVVSIYSSDTGGWSNLISTPVPPEAMYFASKPAVLAGNSLYWLLPADYIHRILEVDLDSQSLAVIPVPTNINADEYGQDLMVIRAEGGGFGVLALLEFTAELWKMNTDRDGVDSWVLEQTIELDRILPLNSDNTRYIAMLAYAEENNLAFLRTVDGIFMVQLESLQFSKLPEYNNAVVCYPFEIVYAAETRVGGGHDRVDQDMLA